MAKRGPKPKNEAGRKPLNTKDYPDTIPDNNLPDKALFNIQEVEVYFGITRPTVNRWCLHGILTAIEKGGNIYITRESMLKCKLK
jgi:hypothetical protein